MMCRVYIVAALAAIAACAEETAVSTANETAAKTEPASAQPEVAGRNMDPRCTKFRGDARRG